MAHIMLTESSKKEVYCPEEASADSLSYCHPFAVATKLQYGTLSISADANAIFLRHTQQLRDVNQHPKDAKYFVNVMD